MNKLALIPLALTGALLVSAPAQAASSSSCKVLKPTKLKATPNAAGTKLKVTWKVSKKAPKGVSFRVARNGKTVGQTRKKSLSVRTSATATPKITVTVIRNGRKTKCKATLKVKTKGPAQVVGLAARPQGDHALVLTWDAVAGAKSYRVLRDGKSVRQLKTRTLTVAISSNRTYRYQIAAVDRAGRVGRASSTVTVKTGHKAPGRPVAPAASDVTETEATISWGAATAFRGRITSYRLLDADGRTVRGVQGTQTRLTNLSTLQTRTYRVVAVDSLGWTSAASDAVSFTTAHAAPGAPSAPRANSVTDTSVSLVWDPTPLPKGSALRGYRVLRDGAVVAQVPATTAEFGNLAPKATYGWSVQTVDTRGYVSAPSPVTPIAQADPPATTGDAHAFLLASTDSSFAAFREHYRQIGTVSPTFWDCNTVTGAVEGRNDAAIVTYAQDRKVKVLARYNCQRTAVVSQILNDPAMRATWLDRMVADVDRYGYDGINLDFEAILAEDRDALTAFVAELASRLHARGKLLSQAVSAKIADVKNHPRSTAFDYVELSKHLDTVFVMAWGIHWATSAPGAQDDLPWVTKVADYVASLPRKEKFVMGTMLYGMDWPNGGGAKNEATGRFYDDIMALSARHGVAPVYSPANDSWQLKYTDEAGVPHEIWYSDHNAVGNRMKIARDRGLGIGFWRLGQEDTRIWAHPLVGGTA